MNFRPSPGRPSFLEPLMTDYFRFEQSKVLNLITTSNANIAYDKSEKLAIVSGLENVGIWNIRTGALVQIFLL